MKQLTTVVLILIIGNTLLYSLHAEVITTKKLIRETIDIHRLAEFPRRTYETVQFSSYDRHSKLPQGQNRFSTDTHIGSKG